MLAGLPPARDVNFRAGLDCYAAWRDDGRPIGARYAALRRAISLFEEALKSGRTMPRLIATARAQYDAGQRSSANVLAIEAGELIDAGRIPDEPFPPLLARYEALVGDPKGWMTMAWIEALERGSKFSSYFGKALPQVNLLVGTKFHTAELERRRALSAVLRGENVGLRMDLSRPMPGHLNAETWTRLIG